MAGRDGALRGLDQSGAGGIAGLIGVGGIQRKREKRILGPHLIEASSAVGFGGVAGAVVEVQADEGEGDAGGLDGGGVVPEPDDCDDDDEDAFDE